MSSAAKRAFEEAAAYFEQRAGDPETLPISQMLYRNFARINRRDAANEPEDHEMNHASDCAMHNEPAEPNGQCDCGACGPDKRIISLDMAVRLAERQDMSPGDIVDWASKFHAFLIKEND